MRRIREWSVYNLSRIRPNGTRTSNRHVWHSKAGANGSNYAWKEAPLEEVEAVALQLKPLCKEHEAILVLDDHVELARKLEVDGVHLGKKDMPIDQARQILGEAFIIGGTANTFEDVVQHYRAGADYLGIGPFRFTTTKKNLSPVLGLEGYSSILSQMKEANIEIPVVAIGGITYEDIPAILHTGVNGIALSGTILGADNPIEETRRILNHA